MHVRNVYSVYVMSMAQLLDKLVVVVKVAKEYNLLQVWDLRAFRNL